VLLPKVGAVQVWGLSFEKLPEALRLHLAKAFKNPQINVTMGKLRTIKVYVVGEVKEPGDYNVSSLSTLIERLGTVKMDFSYAEYFKAEPSTGYETLLFDALVGDQTLYHRMDIVEAGWKIVDPVLVAWAQDGRSPMLAYEPGSWGPPDADLLVEGDDRQWRC
jgi:glucose-6-phosphate 1-dehydrogenase